MAVYSGRQSVRFGAVAAPLSTSEILEWAYPRKALGGKALVTVIAGAVDGRSKASARSDGRGASRAWMHARNSSVVKRQH